MLLDGSKYLQKFGDNIRNIRKEKGLSLRQLAAFCSIDHSDIGKIEKGQVNITLLTLTNLAEALGVSPSILVVGIEQ